MPLLAEEAVHVGLKLRPPQLPQAPVLGVRLMRCSNRGRPAGSAPGNGGETGHEQPADRRLARPDHVGFPVRPPTAEGLQCAMRMGQLRTRLSKGVRR